MAPTAAASTVAAASTTATTAVATPAATARMSNGAVTEFRMMAVAVMLFPRMADDKVAIIPATPTPVRRVAICGVTPVAAIVRSASACGRRNHTKHNERCD